MRDPLISVWTLFFVCHSSELTLTSSTPTSIPRATRSADGHHLLEDLRITELRRYEELEDAAQSAAAAADLSASARSSSFEPYFAMTERHVKAPFGGTAYLNCRILQLGDRVVSWVRQSDTQILTSNTFVYTSDSRFRATHSPVTNEWTLEIRDPSFNDSGAYECQTPGLHGKLGVSIILEVIELEHRITGGPVVLVRDGQDLELNCLINFIPRNWDASYVFWMRDKKLLNFDASGRVHLSREVVKNGSSEEHVLSKLRIRESDQSDSGNYSCQLNAPSTDSTHSHPAHVQVFVLDEYEYASASQGIAFKDGSRLNPAKSWSASAALQMQQRMLLSLLLLQTLVSRLGIS